MNFSKKSLWACGIMAVVIGLTLAPVAGHGADVPAKKPAGKRAAAKKTKKPKEPLPTVYPPDYHPPLAYGRDFVEVTGDGVLRGRYRYWGDWDKEFASYLADAKAAAAARGTPCRKVTMGCIFLKNATITLQDVKGGDGKPMTGRYSTPQSFIEGMTNKCMKEYRDYMFAFSGGELEVDWVVETLENMHWEQSGAKNTGWGCQPKALGDQVLKALEKYKDRGVCMWMFCAGRPETLNPVADLAAKKGSRGIGPPPFGISYTAWPLHGGYTLVISQPLIGLMVHEFNHRYLDNLRDHEGVGLTRFHGLAALGFSRCGFPSMLDHAQYRFTYQYIIPRDMWRRFTITQQNKTPKEPFRGKAYVWNEVKDDCWFKLPDLTDAGLARLTGIPSVKIAGDREAKEEECRSWTVGPADAGKVLSPYAGKPAEPETALNNIMKIRCESCAVLKTATGHWLLVKKELADLYADMLKISGKGDQALPAYGYVNHEVLPLLLLKAPADLPVPSCEEGYFRMSVAAKPAK